jgi:D-glycero-alpha-D-manno-heptose-7-phosphate kinase
MDSGFSLSFAHGRDGGCMNTGRTKREADRGKEQRPRKVNAVAPIRICDIGGWTDTWFAKHGSIFNIAVYPYVEVQVGEHVGAGKGSISIKLENYNESYTLDPGSIAYGSHPLIDAAIDIVGLPPDVSLDVNVFSSAPPGASTGTSAAVAVALIAALSTIAGKHLAPYEIASLAHSVETEKLKLQCGIQDQMSSAYGGINFIQMHQFPHASVSQVQIPNPIWWELENRLALVYIGSPHSSSDIHKKVIADLGDDAESDPRFERLRLLAEEAKESLFEGDFERLGKVMDENTDVQRRLHRGLVCPRFEKAIEVAKQFGATGCKVNGAGGDRGSLTILGDGDASRKRRMMDAIEAEELHPIPIYLSRYGVRVW